MNDIIHEITPLSQKDCFYLVDRLISEFNFPIHRHKEYELNFIENAEGVVRVVGDSIETISNYDLVLIAKENLEHGWTQSDCKSSNIREVTIQFSAEIFSDTLLSRNQFESIDKMFNKAKMGLSFSMNTILKVYSLLDNLSAKSGFEQFLDIIRLIYMLSLSDDSRTLSNSSFAKTDFGVDSRRVEKINTYINKHYQEQIRLETLSDLVGMTPPAFSRFFKVRTGLNLTEYITDIRLGYASRLLIDTTKSVSEICYECGFNNISNFNRIFKKRKNLTPKEFREMYHQKRVVV